jgi:hypothetical protein
MDCPYIAFYSLFRFDALGTAAIRDSDLNVPILRRRVSAPAVQTSSQGISFGKCSGSVSGSRSTVPTAIPPPKNPTYYSLERRWDGAEGGTRTPTGFPTTPSRWRVCQFHHFGICSGPFFWNTAEGPLTTLHFRASAPSCSGWQAYWVLTDLIPAYPEPG